MVEGGACGAVAPLRTPSTRRIASLGSTATPAAETRRLRNEKNLEITLGLVGLATSRTVALNRNGSNRDE